MPTKGDNIMQRIIPKVFIVIMIIFIAGNAYTMGVRPETPPESNPGLTDTEQELGAQMLAAIIANLPDSNFKGNLNQLLETGFMTIIENDNLGVQVEMGINWSYTDPGLIFKYAFDQFMLLDGTIVSGKAEAIIVCGFKNLFLSTLDIVINTADGSPISIENGELEGTLIAFDDAMVSFDIRNLATKGFVDESYGVSGSAVITPFGMASEETNIEIDHLMDYLNELKSQEK